MESTFSTNLTCGNCVRKVEAALNALSQVEHWEVDTAHPEKILRIRHVSVDDIPEVQNAVASAGFEANPRSGNAIHETSDANVPKESFRLSNYKPLALVFLYVLGLTVWSESLAAADGSAYETRRAMSFFMGYFFLAFAFFKLLDVSAFATAFAQYDPVASRSRTWGLAYPFVEFGLGVGFLSRRWPQVVCGITIVLMTVGLIGVLNALRRKQTIQCACLGTAFNLPMSVVTVVENSVMIGMSLFMLF